MNASPPLVSLIIRTVAGRKSLLKEAIASVERQTYRPLEIIVIEDGSALARDITLNDSSIVYRYQSIPKSGRSTAGNAGLAIATGDYLGFLDDDDQLYPHHVATLVAALQTNAEIPAAYSMGERRDTVFASLEPLEYKEKTTRRPKSLPSFCFNMLFASVMPIHAVLFQKALYTQYGGFNPLLEYYEDTDLWLRYAQAGMFVPVPHITCFFRKDMSSASLINRYHASQQHIKMFLDLSATYQWKLPLKTLREQSTLFLVRYRLRCALKKIFYQHGWVVRGYTWVKKYTYCA